MMIAALSTPLMGAVDTALLGHLASQHWLASVAIGAQAITLIFWVFGCLRMGTTSVAARAMGKKDQLALNQLLFRGLLMGLILGLLLIAIGRWPLHIIISTITESTARNITASEYTNIRLLGAPFVLCQYVIIGILVGTQRSRLAMLAVLLQNLLNIGFDWLFIMQFDMKAEGAAYASVIAEASTFVLSLATLILSKSVSVPVLKDIFDVVALKTLFLLNRQLFVRTLCLQLVFVYFTAQGDRYGVNVLAANAILINLLSLASYLLDGFAYASESLVGEAVGANDSAGMTSAAAISSLLSMILATILSIIFWLFQSTLLSMYTHFGDVIAVANQFYGWLIIMPILGVACYQLDGIALGFGQAGAMQNSMLIATLAGFAPLVFITQGMGNHGLWLSFAIFHVARALLLFSMISFRWRQLLTK